VREKDPSREVWRARLLLQQKIDDSGDDDERSTRGEIVPVVFRKDRTDARAEEVSELLVFFTPIRVSKSDDFRSAAKTERIDAIISLLKAKVKYKSKQVNEV